MSGEFDLYEFDQSFSDDIQLSYKGPFDSAVLSVIGGYIVNIIGKKTPLSQKIFKVFIELAENISEFSAERASIDKKTGMGTLLIREQNEKFIVYTGNKVPNSDVKPILEKAEIINSLDRDALREFKRTQRNLPRGNRGNANIGLVQVALTSNNPVYISSEKVDENFSFLSIKVELNK